MKEVCIKAPNINTRELLKRKFGLASAHLGPGRVKGKVVEDTLDFLIEALIKEPSRKEKKKLVSTVAPTAAPTTTSTTASTAAPTVASTTASTPASSVDTTVASTNPAVVTARATEDTVAPTPVASWGEAETEEGEEDQYQQVTRRVCWHFTKGRCKYGSNCRFSHPDICPAYTRFGPGSNTNPKGCPSKNCEMIHHKDKWCKRAIKTNRCLYHECQASHFKGVQRRDNKQGGKPSIPYRQTTIKNPRPSAWCPATPWASPTPRSTSTPWSASNPRPAPTPGSAATSGSAATPRS